jgi:hypothetical protein
MLATHGPDASSVLMTRRAYSSEISGRGVEWSKRRPPSRMVKWKPNWDGIALADELIELAPFLLAQIHNIFLDDNLFRRHESSPSPPRHGMDSQSPIKRNDARH